MGTAEQLTIGRLAQVGGVNLETIRYYEREGLLPRPPRTRSGYRVSRPMLHDVCVSSSEHNS